ncbi:MAG: hypothetical protein JWP69_1174 [Flaviaesturariibacter sp.]|nr:hypothetical protein [Flaviaesturariibacter sp.]
MVATKKPKLTGAEEVAAFMQVLEHPLKEVVEAVRTIILAANPAMAERIKWKSPSFYCIEDLGAFNLRRHDVVHLVLVFPKGLVCEDIPWLEGDYRDRRMAYFSSLSDVAAKRAELERLVNDWVERIDAS